MDIDDNHATQQEGESSSASLEQSQLLLPPPKTLGSGPTALRYSPQSPAWHCTFSRNGEWLAACFGAPDPCIRIWKLGGPNNNNNNQQWTLHSTLTGVHERTIRSVAFAPLSKSCILAVASFDATVSIWEYDSKNDEWDCTTQLEGHENEVKAVAWNATGSLLATSGRDKTVWLWETYLDGSVGGTAENDFECVAVLNGHDGDVKCIQFAASHGQWGDGDEILLSGGYDDTIKVWAEDTGDWYCAMSISDVHSDTIWSLAVAPGSGRLVSSSADGSLAILKCYTVREKKEKFPDQASGR
jgi:WD40 repeat protein